LGEDKDVIGIDEAQFFDENLPEVCNKLAARGIRIVIAGLDMDYLGRPFGVMPALMAIADEVAKVHAVCMSCGEPALFSHRLVDNENTILLGEKNEYEPRCRNCNKI
jgi:thymidine kinase